MATDEKRFPEFGSDYSFSKLEEKILDFWKREKTFEGLQEASKEKESFYFYDGPPFATGLPHYGHLLAGTIKDIVPRYWAQRGFFVERRFGWDCHGLPVEFEIEKKLGLSGSLAIRDYGIDKFCEECRGAVLRYTGEWRSFVERMGRWIDMDNDYKTMDPDFMESVWWVFKRLFDKGLIYQGKKVVPYSWRLTAPLSNFEASQNYKSVQDPSITVLLPFVDPPKGWENTALAVWTTTPWTLPSNLSVAVQCDQSKIQYARYRLKEEFGEIKEVILARSSAEQYGLGDQDVIEDVLASQLLNKHYRPLFSLYADEEREKQKAFRVLDGSSFVVEGKGSALVHMAPAFGEVDFYIAQEAGIDLVDPTNMEGEFSDEVNADPDLKSAGIAGKFVKDADKAIIAKIKEKGLLLKHETFQHNYPFCERSDTPLIYKAISSWFVKVDAVKEQMLENNQKIRWVPDHIQDGRFGKWLENARDWCISRNRFWGTPIPVWICEKCGHLHVVASREELSKLTGQKCEDLHKHFVDHDVWDCSECGAEKSMKRTPEVLDCWFESGSMPYAQEHYPFENKEKLEKEFPADFIAEGLDQTRGWFYTLTVLSTILFEKPAFKNCIVNGMVLAEDGRKMSKRLRNYPDPKEIFDQYGADALRLYLVQSPAMHADDLRFSEKNLLELMRAVILPLWNAYGFFASYANIDGWDPDTASEDMEYSDLDRWIFSRSKELEKKLHVCMESYKLYEAAPLLIEFIDDLTNWYIRLNRDRFWAKRDTHSEANKEAAYRTLYEVLRSLSLNIASIMPFMSEVLNASLEGRRLDSLDQSYSSIHGRCFEDVSRLELNEDEEKILRQVSVAKKIMLLGRALRGEAKIGLRQPLPKMRVAGLSEKEAGELESIRKLICSEVNIKEIEIVEKAGDLVEESAKPNFKTLGRKLGRSVKELQKVLATWGSSELQEFEASGSFVFDGHDLGPNDIEVVRKAKDGKLAQADFGIVAELDVSLNEELIDEGVQREIVNRIQQRRKEMNFDLTDRIHVTFWAEDGSRVERLLRSEVSLPAYISNETLALKIEPSSKAPHEKKERIGDNGELCFSLERTKG